MGRMTSLAVLFVAGLVFAGCVHHPGGIAPSTKPLAPGGYTELGRVEGEDCVYHLLGLVPLTNGNELRDAVADALRKRPLAEALTEVTVDGYWQFFILFSRACTQVQGMAVEVK
ncbi:MAG: hypothetical protein KF814_01070 [Nitrospiraceae bacterium]|nr:hypothetical protein [Nitrospiraceae bacterium]